MDRSRARVVLALALPIIGGMVSQNVLNLVDTAMVGSLGDAALAAVGMGSFANFMAQAFITGLSSGVQAMSARRKGEERLDVMAVPLNGGLLLAVLLALPLTALLLWQAPALFAALNDDPAVQQHGVPYLQVRLLGMAGIGMNFAFRGYWNGVNRSRLYLNTLLIMHTCNIALNYTLIYGHFGFPALGTTGAAIGTTVSTYVGTLTYFLLGLRHARLAGFLRGLPDQGTIRTMLRLAVPTGIQQFFFAAGYTLLFWIVGQVGTRELAAANVLINVTLVAILPGIALGIAAASLVGQALGRRDPADASRWGWDVVQVAMVGLMLLALPMIVAPDLVLGAFLHDPETLAVGRLPLQLTGAFMFLDAVGLVLLNAMLGAGATRSVLLVSTSLQWLLFLPAAYVIGPVLGLGLVAIWCAQIGQRALQAIIFAWLWRGGSWAKIEV